jgi:hypothetical protein
VFDFREERLTVADVLLEHRADFLPWALSIAQRQTIGL